MKEVTVTDVKDYEQRHVDEAMEYIFSQYEGIIPKNGKVFVKINLVRDMSPEKAGTTHPAVVRAVVKVLEKYTDDITVGDSSGGKYTAGYMNAVYNKCGITAAVKDTKAVLNTDFSSTSCEFDGKTVRHLDITDSFLKADTVINTFFYRIFRNGKKSLRFAARAGKSGIPQQVSASEHILRSAYGH